MTHIHIHAPCATAKRAHFAKCHDCKQRSRFLAFFTPWYGWDVTCSKCGRNWKDGEWMPLDFKRGAREESVWIAKQKWKAMPPVSKNHYGIDA